MEKAIEYWVSFVGVSLSEITEKEIIILEPVRSKLVTIMNKDIVTDKDFNELYIILDNIMITEKYSRVVSNDDALLAYNIHNDAKRSIMNYQKRLKRELKDTAGKLIRSRREAMGLTLSMMCSLMGFSEAYLSKIENNERKVPSIEIIDGICELLEISKSDLVNYEEIDEEKYIYKKAEISLDNLLYFNNIRGISDADKEGLGNLILSIVNLEWSEITKVLDSVTLINLVSKYKNKIDLIL